MILSNIKENGPADCTPSTHLTADPFLHGDELCGVFLLQDDAVLVVSARVGDVNLQAVEYGITCNSDETKYRLELIGVRNHYNSVFCRC